MKKTSRVLKLQAYATLARSQTWTLHLKPELEKIKAEAALIERMPETEFEAIKNDIKRSNTIAIIDRIIREIEQADDKIGNTYRRK